MRAKNLFWSKKTERPSRSLVEEKGKWSSVYARKELLKT